MSRLIHTELPTAGQCYACEQTPTLVSHGVADDLLAVHRSYEDLHIGTHQVELVDVVSVVFMYGHLRGRQAKNYISPSGVDAGQLENIAQEDAVGVRIGAADDTVRSNNHDCPPTIDRGR